MYCKNCGQKIVDDSRFCQHCGTLQKYPSPTENLHHVVAPQTVQKLERVSGINLSKQVIGIYLTWFLIHLILLLVNWDANSSAGDRLWPFKKYSGLDDYDFTEFLLYTIVPLIFLVIVNLFSDSNEIRPQTRQSKYDLAYDRDYTPTFIGIILITVALIYYYAIFIEQNGLALDNELHLKYKIWFNVILFAIRIIVVIYIVEVAKTLNRNRTGWGFLAFFLPMFSLIVIGFKRKMKSPH